MKLAFGPALPPVRGYAYGNAVLSRFPIEAMRTYDLSGDRARASVLHPGRRRVPRGADSLLSAHLGLGWRERRRQAAALLSADILRDAALAYPLVLVGDFNSLTRRSAVPRWLRRQLTDSALATGDVAPTFPARFPLLRLDRCTSTAFAVRGARVVRLPSPAVRPTTCRSWWSSRS